MSTTFDPETEKKISTWSEKLGKSVEVLRNQLRQLTAYEKQFHPTLSDADALVRARHILATRYAAELRPEAAPFEAVWFFAALPRDTNSALIQTAVEMYKQNPQGAITAGLVLPDGKPRDTRPYLIEPAEGVAGRKNPNFGKELKPFFQQRIIGYGTRYGKKKFKLLSATRRGPQAEQELVLNKPTVSRWNIRGEDDYRVYLTSSVATKFELTTIPELEPWNEDRVKSILGTAPKDVKISVLELEEWHSKHRKNPMRVGILEADLLGIREEETTAGNFLLTFGDVEEDIELPPIPCFVSKDIFDRLKELGKGSRLYVLGWTSLGRDMTTGEKTRVTWNALSVWVKFAISKEESVLDIAEKVEWKPIE